MTVTQLVQDMTIMHVTEYHLWAMLVIRTGIALALMWECGYRLSHMGTQAKWQIRLAVILMLGAAVGILISQLLPIAWPMHFKWAAGLIPNEIGLYALAVMYYMQRVTSAHWAKAAKTSADGRALPNAYRKESVQQCDRVEQGDAI